MIFVYNGNGDLLNKIPSRVYQGSNKASTIYFIAPYSSRTVVNVAFRLPNGELRPQRLMSVLENGQTIDGVEIGGLTVSAWAYDVPEAITAYAGSVIVQFYVTTANAEKVATENATFTVEKGVPPIEIPDDDNSYQAVIDALAQIQGILNNFVADTEEELDEKFSTLESSINNRFNELEANSTPAQVIRNTNNIKALFNLQLEKNVLAADGATLTEEIQQTGGAELEGFDILDNSYATVNKINGATVASKNLITSTYPSKTNSGVTITALPNNTYLFNGTPDDTAIKGFVDAELNSTKVLKAGKTYTFSGCPSVSNGIRPGSTTYRGVIRLYKTNGDYITGIYDEGNGVSYTPTVDCTFVYVMRVYVGTTVIRLYFSPMAVEGSSVLPYQPYFEGMKSAEISSIKSTGRNLFNKEETADGYEFVNELGGTGAKSNWFVSGYIRVIPNTTYKVSGKPSGSYVIYYDIFKNALGNLSGGNDKTFTTPNNCAFVRLNGLLSEKDTFQLELGNVATPYKPYIERNMSLPETVELGQYDYIQDGQIHKSTSEVYYFDGSEDWEMSSNLQEYLLDLRVFGFVIQKDRDITTNSGLPFRVTGGSDVGGRSALCLDASNLPYTPQGSTEEELVAEWKAYLAQNPFYAVFKKYKDRLGGTNLETITPIAFDNRYLVWNKGTEQVIAPTDGNGLTPFNYGANTTEENDYYIIVGE